MNQVKDSLVEGSLGRIGPVKIERVRGGDGRQKIAYSGAQGARCKAVNGSGYAGPIPGAVEGDGSEDEAGGGHQQQAEMGASGGALAQVFEHAEGERCRGEEQAAKDGSG